jgi:hypothetical protein
MMADPMAQGQPRTAYGSFLQAPSSATCYGITGSARAGYHRAAALRPLC